MAAGAARGVGGVGLDVDDRVVRVSNPDRVYFPPTASAPSGATKLDLVEYYLAVGPGIVNALYERPCMLHRFPKGLAGDKVHQKRLPAGAPYAAVTRSSPSPVPVAGPAAGRSDMVRVTGSRCTSRSITHATMTHPDISSSSSTPVDSAYRLW